MTLSPNAFAWVSDLVRREAAIVLTPGKEYLVEARLTGLARAAGASDVADYVTTLKARGTPAQRMAVVAARPPHELSWFGDGAPFDVLFRSVVETYGGRVLGLVLTGMGADGARGAGEIVRAGGSVFVQDEATSVVWGMPVAVTAAGFAARQLPLADVASAVTARILGRGTTVRTTPTAPAGARPSVRTIERTAL